MNSKINITLKKYNIINLVIMQFKIFFDLIAKKMINLNN